ncbi:DUF305 domain-containing protein [Deinococcus sp. UYEF24]
MQTPHVPNVFRPKRLLLLVTLALAPWASAQTSMPTMSHVAATSASPLGSLKGKAFDRAFLSMMLVHHQGAVDMSESVLKKLNDPQVKTWTADIIRVQKSEIDEMKAWVGALGGVDRSVQTGMKSEMTTMLSALKSSENSDVGLVRGMLPHHASAISMANLALQKSSDPRILTLAHGIIRSQADEMYAYRQWLIKRGL